MESVVELRGVSKAFVLRHNPALNLKVQLLGLFHPRQREQLEKFWALHEIDLTVRKGECLGLIGPNGSGKSTLLRIMASIYRPTAGEVVVRGRVAPMIELGVGFQPDLTGQENVYLNTSLFGLSKRETDMIYEKIVEFAELGRIHRRAREELLERDVHARLGFSAAVHLDPDILLIDEILAVGDEHFQQKCLHRMGELRRRGTTIILVSHDMQTIERMCDRVCLLVRGRLEAEGDPGKVVARYREVLSAEKP